MKKIGSLEKFLTVKLRAWFYSTLFDDSGWFEHKMAIPVEFTKRSGHMRVGKENDKQGERAKKGKHKMNS